MTYSLAFRIAALVVFILDALFCFGVGNVALETEVGFLAVGGACLAASGLPLP